MKCFKIYVLSGPYVFDAIESLSFISLVCDCYHGHTRKLSLAKSSLNLIN